MQTQIEKDGKLQANLPSLPPALKIFHLGNRKMPVCCSESNSTQTARTGVF
jgi:hypothetical protein